MAHIAHFFGKLSLRTKFSVCLFLLIIFPLLVSIVMVNAEIVSNINTKTRVVIYQTMQQTQLNVENMINETEDLSLTLASDENLQALGSFYAQSGKKSADAGPVNLTVENESYNLFLTTQALFEGKKYIDALCFSNAKGIVYQYSSVTVGDEVVREDTQYHKSAAMLKGIGFWTPVYQLKNTYNSAQTPYVVSFIRAVNDLNGPRQLGVERISLDASAMSQQYQKANAWNGASIFIVDSTGHIVSSPQTGLLGRYVGAAPYVARAFSEQNGFFASSVANRSATIFHYALADTGWQMILAVPDQDLDTQLVITNFSSTISVFLCLLFGILFSIIQNKTIISPLKKLEKEMQKITRGDFEIHLNVTSGDEIGTLGRVFNNMAVRLKQYIEREYKSQIRQREAELRVLQAQINPHFLYNTLDSIRWTAVEHGDYAVCEQLEALSELFRHALNKGNERTTVSEEIEHLKNYLLIQQSRFSDKLEVTFDIDSEVLPYKMLKLLLQPVVENAVYHGIEQKRGKGSIHLKIARVEDEVHFTVTDDGMGANEQDIRDKLLNEEERQSVFALKNIHERIQLCYGAQYGLTFYSQVAIGTVVEIRIPAQMDDMKGSDL